MIEKGISIFRGERVLLLQGPVGPFFRRLADDLTLAGAQVFKVNFNGGDWLFYPGGAFNYRGRMEDWPKYFEALLDQLNVDVVMLFGDCRPIHKLAHEIAHRRGLEIGVFEEGYLRPDYVTLERFGVNDHSLIPREASFYSKIPVSTIDRPIPLGNTYWYAVLWALLYYFAAGLLKPLFRHYAHHRPLTWMELLPWMRSVWRKGYYALKERSILGRLKGELNGRYFLVPLQVYNDAQIHTHSGFKSIGNFIDVVMSSFASHAPQDATLVIKHHPMDRGYHDYTRLIHRRVEELGLHGRCFYIHDQHLPTLMQNSCGVVVINSTVGLSALHHGAPLKVCGNAIYDLPGLTFQGGLDDFWQNHQKAKPDKWLLARFNGYLVQHTQLNGSFYKRLPIIASVAGLRWKLQPGIVVIRQPVERKDKAA
jgi:capsular polysaccharide export protein